MRLPNVIVPVLSSRSVSTSPAASTARPEVAMTLKRTSRSMPAMPMADRSPPIVVGMRQTSSAISTVADRSVPEYLAIGHKVTQTIRKMMVSPRQQDRQRQFVRRLLAFGALDQRDHSIDEGRARRGGDLHLDEVGEHRRSAGDRRPVAASLANDRRRFAGDRRFVDGGHPFDDVAVAGDDLAGLDQHDIAQAKIERVHPFDEAVEVLGIDVAPWRACRCACGARRRPAPCPALRRRLRRNSRTAP